MSSDELVFERRIELPDMIAYAGATWDWHKLHYDAEYLRERGLDRPVVDGQVFGAYLAIALREWFPGAVVSSLSFRFKNLVFAGETIRCVGALRVADLGASVADLGASVADLGAVAADFGASVADLGATAADLGTAEADLGVRVVDLGVSVVEDGRIAVSPASATLMMP